MSIPILARKRAAKKLRMGSTCIKRNLNQMYPAEKGRNSISLISELDCKPNVSSRERKKQYKFNLCTRLYNKTMNRFLFRVHQLLPHTPELLLLFDEYTPDLLLKLKSSIFRSLRGLRKQKSPFGLLTNQTHSKSSETVSPLKGIYYGLRTQSALQIKR